jgi:hypothetical protein
MMISITHSPLTAVKHEMLAHLKSEHYTEVVVSLVAAPPAGSAFDGSAA